MKRANAPSVGPGDELDTLLRSFFEAEVPAPWPDFRPPTRTRLLPQHTSRGTSAAWHSRLALATALSVFVAGMAFWSNSSTSSVSPPTLSTLGDGTAGKGAAATVPNTGAKAGTLTPAANDRTPRSPFGDDPGMGLDFPFEERSPNK